MMTFSARVLLRSLLCERPEHIGRLLRDEVLDALRSLALRLRKEDFVKDLQGIKAVDGVRLMAENTSERQRATR